MYTFKVVFHIEGGPRTEEIIRALNSSEAKKIIQARYSGLRISFSSVTRI